TGDDAPSLFDNAPSNVAVDHELGRHDETESALKEADHVVEVDLVNNRLIPNALEPRAALAEYDTSEDQLIIKMTSQAPHRHRGKIAETLGMPEQRIRVIAPNVGGGFGHKGHHHPGEAVAAWSAMELDRPVKWAATRSENYLAGAHGRDHVTTAKMGVNSDGDILGMKVETHAGVGGYGLGASPAIAAWYGRLLSSQYRIPSIYCRARSVFTNTAPVHSYRGAGRPEAIYVTERLIDVAARELEMDPVELRRRNLIDPDAFPYETPVGAVYDSGDYEETLEKALNSVEYDELRERQSEYPKEGVYLGIGIACYVESTGGGFESGVVRVHPSGGVTVYTGTHSHGQGHQTTYAQIVADELGVPYDDIEVVEGDTERIPVGTGTFGSRSTITGGSAVAESAEKIKEKAKKIAAHKLETAEEDIEFSSGEFHVKGAPERSVPFAEVANAAYSGSLPDDIERGLDETTFFEPEGTCYTFGTHVAVVGVDVESGEVEVKRYVAVDDCGNQINPKIVEGQVHGGVAQGFGQALYERAVYDDNGNLITGSMQDYAVPKIFQIPEMETDSTVTPSPHNPLGVKGIGEAGTIATPPAVVNAVVDALEPFGVQHLDMPLTSEKIWRAIRD
ncbi:MAG: molybdopterin cofactor-binding domain-containing protein, partial [Halobacteria archaeon]|nr:molybdopterin cofactor-binding domain-containing protein [Halobacteria archaeon]